MISSTIAVIPAVAIFVAIILYFRFYCRASKEIAFVRTGFGGEKVVMGGGAIVVPLLQEVTRVNLNTLRLQVARSEERSVITKDRMRVDVLADFYVHVAPSKAAIATAAATLGSRTLRPEAVREIVEGKFVDGICAVAAEMTMEELHEQRKSYAAKIRESLAEDLSRNGLELESVSITSLDQTDMEYFNPSNAFDAEGLTRLTETIEQRKKKRNDIEQDTQIQIRKKNLESEKLNISLEQESQFAYLSQQLDIETRKAEQSSEIARRRAVQAQAADEADIEKQKKTDIAKILSDHAVSEERIERERSLREREIEKEKVLKLVEQITDQEVLQGSLSQMEAQVKVQAARAGLVAAEEQVATAREKEAAERRKVVTIIEAARKAEQEAVTLKLLAEAEKVVAVDKAEAAKIRAAADEIRYRTDAEGQRAINEARNLLSSDQISAEMKKYLIDHLPEIIRESGEPLKNIDSIRIVQTDGLLPKRTEGSGDGGGLFDSVLKYRAQAPVIDALLKDLGFSADGTVGKVLPSTKPDADDVKSTKP